jgi:glycosyltransferase involved in cell wall biosynthesis
LPFHLMRHHEQLRAGPKEKESCVRIAMVGTRGVPARYGGFETAVEEIGRRLVARGHEVVVYCRGENRCAEYLGMRRVVLPAVRSRTAETVSHTALSLAHLVAHRTDVALVFNAANAPLLPILRTARIPVAVHVDGLEWKRGKWGPTGRRYYLGAERLAVRWADALIADAVGIQDYYRERYGVHARFLPYGAPLLTAPAVHRLSELGLRSGGYHLVVARLEPENHVDVVLRGYLASSAEQPLVVVGSAPYAGSHVDEVNRLAASDVRVRQLGGVWDQELLDALYAGASSYLHGHSVGGTNPSLLRALGAGAPVVAFDVDFNREVMGDAGLFFADDAEVTAALKQVEADPADARERGEAGRAAVAERYRWDDVADGYEDLCRRLLAGEPQP